MAQPPIRRAGAKCIIVDTVQAILNPSVTNKNYDVTVEEYDALRKLAHKLSIAIIVVHHCKKTTDISSEPLEKVIGSIGITGTAETILVMEQLKGTQDCKLTVIGKDVEQAKSTLRGMDMALTSATMCVRRNRAPHRSWF